MVKLITNLTCAAVAIWGFYRAFFFLIVPKLVAHYSEAAKHERKYEEKISKIRGEK